MCLSTNKFVLLFGENLMPTKLCRLAAGVLAILLYSSTAIGDTFWLSDKSPHAGHSGAHAHGGPVKVRRGVYYKNLWLRHGNQPQESNYLVGGTHFSPLMLLDTKGQLIELKIERDKMHGMLNVNFPMPDEGFYNVYINHQWLNKGQRLFLIAKAEVLKHSCREGHDNVQEKMPPRHNSKVPLEIVRERLTKENFHTLLGHGDTVSFIVMRNGKPQPGAEVTLTTAQGWSKMVTSDDSGRVSYEMIRDYYPKWHEFNKRNPQPYIVSAEYKAPVSGFLEGEYYNNTLYRSSYSGNYYPSPRDYESYAYGLSFGLFAIVFSGLAIYLYRRRRNRPYREVSFNE